MELTKIHVEIIAYALSASTCHLRDELLELTGKGNKLGFSDSADFHEYITIMLQLKKTHELLIFFSKQLDLTG